MIENDLGIKCRFSSHWLSDGVDEFCEDCSEKQRLVCELLAKRSMSRYYIGNSEYLISKGYKEYDDQLIDMLMNEIDSKEKPPAATGSI